MAPVTPKLSNNSIAITLPIVQIRAADPAIPIPEHTLYQWITTPPTTWDQTLWDQI